MKCINNHTVYGLLYSIIKKGKKENKTISFKYCPVCDKVLHITKVFCGRGT